MHILHIPSKADIQHWIDKAIDERMDALTKLTHSTVPTDITLADDAPVSHLDLSVRASTCLRNACVATVGELCKLSQADLSKYRNLGHATMREIKTRLALVGRGLREP